MFITLFLISQLFGKLETFQSKKRRSKVKYAGEGVALGESAFQAERVTCPKPLRLGKAWPVQRTKGSQCGCPKGRRCGVLRM